MKSSLSISPGWVGLRFIPEFVKLMKRSELMVVAELDVVCLAIYESEADPPLIIHGNRMLPSSISGKRMKPITRRNSQIVEARREIDILQLSSRPLRHIRRDPLPLPEAYNSCVRRSSNDLFTQRV